MRRPTPAIPGPPPGQPSPRRLAPGWRPFPLDGKLLLFNRETGVNVLLADKETAACRQVAPRTLLIAVTNACNMACHFCYRDTRSPSHWTRESLVAFCREADSWGVLEVAFGGGEPLLFPGWADMLVSLHETTGLCVNFTTNGTLLTPEFLRTLRHRYGQIRVSLYRDNDADRTIRLLADHGARFGVNWLVTPAEILRLEARFRELLHLGVSDILFIGYKGHDRSLHLGPADLRRLAGFLENSFRGHRDAISLKLDICWGDALPSLPRLFASDDCGAGDDFLSLTSDRRIKPCSFHCTSVGVPFDTLADVRRYWETRRRLRSAAVVGGCARLAGRGLAVEEEATA